MQTLNGMKMENYQIQQKKTCTVAYLWLFSSVKTWMLRVSFYNGKIPLADAGDRWRLYQSLKNLQTVKAEIS